MDIANALNQLSMNNLNPIPSRRKAEEIIGLLEGQTIENHIITGDCYMISFRDDYWIGVIPAWRSDILIARSVDLADVVNGICDFYGLRQTTTDDGLTTKDAAKLLQRGGLITDSIYEDTIWGKTEKQVQTSDGLSSEEFVIFPHAGAWIAVHYGSDEFSNVVKYSRALNDIVRSTIDYFRVRAI